MEDYEIELLEGAKIRGRLRAAGWKGMVTRSELRLLADKCRVLREVPKAEAKKMRAERDKVLAERAKARKDTTKKKPKK